MLYSKYFLKLKATVCPAVTWSAFEEARVGQVSKVSLCFFVSFFCIFSAFDRGFPRIDSKLRGWNKFLNESMEIENFPLVDMVRFQSSGAGDSTFQKWHWCDWMNIVTCYTYMHPLLRGSDLFKQRYMVFGSDRFLSCAC